MYLFIIKLRRFQWGSLLQNWQTCNPTLQQWTKPHWLPVAVAEMRSGSVRRTQLGAAGPPGDSPCPSSNHVQTIWNFSENFLLHCYCVLWALQLGLALLVNINVWRDENSRQSQKCGCVPRPSLAPAASQVLTLTLSVQGFKCCSVLLSLEHSETLLTFIIQKNGCMSDCHSVQWNL